MIEVVKLTKHFGTFQAVRSLDLHVESGEVVALLGPNGAGKTTTVRMLSAILKPTSGQARISGYDVVQDALQVRRSVGLLTEFPGLYQRMRPLEYLLFFCELQQVDALTGRQRGEALLRQFGLWEARNKPLDSFSKGMKQKVSLIRALIHNPPVLYLDEPTTAMDPHSARTVRDAIAELRAARRTILLTTHNLTEAEELADRIVIIRDGAIIAAGTRAQLTRSLLGEPLWELRLGIPAEFGLPVIADLVQAETQGTDWIRFRCSNPHERNPALIARLAQAGIPVLALAELRRSLEDVYLSIIEAPERVN